MKKNNLDNIKFYRLTNTLQVAETGFCKSYLEKNGREPADSELELFIEHVTARIKYSLGKPSSAVDKINRASRLEEVHGTAKAIGVKFLHNREVEEQEVVLKSYLKNNVVNEVIEVTSHSSTCGGSTIAYRYYLDDDNNLGMEYVAAFCRDDENFDPLIGMEESLKKFVVNNPRLTTSLAHEFLGKVKMDELTRSYKKYEVTNN